MTTLLHLTLSPWSEKARWALDHHGLLIKRQEYLPVLGEPALRLKLKDITGPVSVPILFGRNFTLRDSLDIAQWADERGLGSTLFPAHILGEVLRWNALSESALSAARARATTRIIANPKALEALVPTQFPETLRPHLKAISSFGVWCLRQKYEFDSDQDRLYKSRIDGVLGELRKALDGRQTLYETFTYADITAAQILQLISPVSRDIIPLDGETHRAYHDPEIAESWSDLIQWRDELYQAWR